MVIGSSRTVGAAMLSHGFVRAAGPKTKKNQNVQPTLSQKDLRHQWDSNSVPFGTWVATASILTARLQRIWPHGGALGQLNPARPQQSNRMINFTIGPCSSSSTCGHWRAARAPHLERDALEGAARPSASGTAGAAGTAPGGRGSTPSAAAPSTSMSRKLSLISMLQDQRRLPHSQAQQEQQQVHPQLHWSALRVGSVLDWHGQLLCQGSSSSNSWHVLVRGWLPGPTKAARAF